MYIGGERSRISRVQRLNGGANGTAPAEQRLIRHLLRHYDVDARGVPSINSTVPVAIQLLLLRMQQLVRYPCIACEITLYYPRRL